MRRRRLYSPGEAIGPDLTVLGVVDDGGSSPVYIAWHRPAWSPVACKVFTDPEQAEEEAGILGLLSHPNIVRCFGLVPESAGRAAARVPAHLIMEFLEGPTLAGLLRGWPDGRLPVSEAVRVAIHAGAALIHLHERDVLHLDLKPANVIVARGRPVLFDFGTARRRPDWTRPTLEGTDSYMAPEQCEQAPVSPATDLFGFGATLYRMLTGAYPFAEGTRRNPFPQLNTPPVPLRARRRSLPRGLEDLVLSCLARDPADRPASLPDLLVALHGFVRVGPPMWPPGFDPRSATLVPIAQAS